MLNPYNLLRNLQMPSRDMLILALGLVLGLVMGVILAAPSDDGQDSTCAGYRAKLLSVETACETVRSSMRACAGEREAFRAGLGGRSCTERVRKAVDECVRIYEGGQ
jgi:hypothetical protein